MTWNERKFVNDVLAQNVKDVLAQNVNDVMLDTSARPYAVNGGLSNHYVWTFYDGEDFFSGLP